VTGASAAPGPEAPAAGAAGADARLIALDWGTSSLRAYRLGAAGQVLEVRHRPWGILHLPEEGEHGFAAALQHIAGDWLAAAPGLPVIAAGMVGSAQGWREAPYAGVPADAQALATRLLRFEALPGVLLHLVPGVRLGGARPDVMRGEETQIVGLLARQPPLADDTRLVLPGTHSKWVRIDGGRIADFHTYLTGELFALLRAHSILGRPAREAGGGEASDAAFDAGVAAVRDGGAGGATALLFTVRTRVLAGLLPAAHSLDYLSGLLVGDELRCALPGSEGAPLWLVGDAALVARYRRALALSGREATVADGDAAARGLWQIARRAGLCAPD
jgi:2-dehydro-3-deoxygalactonokinase